MATQKKYGETVISQDGDIVTISDQRGAVRGTVKEILQCRAIACELLYRLDKAGLISPDKVVNVKDIKNSRQSSNFFDFLSDDEKNDEKLVKALKKFKCNAQTSIELCQSLKLDKKQIKDTVLKQFANSNRELCEKVMDKLLQ